jgi:hypothetical protein
MNWLTERDALIAQRAAFVKSVTGETPEATAQDATANIVSPRPVLNPPVSLGPRPVEPAPIEPAVAGKSATTFDQAGPAREPSPAGVVVQGDVRAEVQNRIAAFQAHQHRFRREREAYFDSVLAKVRAPHPTGDKLPRS